MYSETGRRGGQEVEVEERMRNSGTSRLHEKA